MTDFLGRIEELRRAFDRGFAEPARPLADEGDLYLAIVLGGNRYALPLAELAGIRPEARLTRLPGAAPEVLGIAGIEGRIVPIFDLGLLLGYPPVGSRAPSVLVARGEPPLGFAVGQLEGHFRAGGGEAGYVRALEQVRSIVSLTTVLASIRARLGDVVQKEPTIHGT